MFGKRHRKVRMMIYAVYLLVLLVAVLLLYWLVPTEVWDVIRQVYGSGEMEL